MRYASVTGILGAINKPALVPWAAGLAAEIALENPKLTKKEVVGKVFQKRNDKADLGKLIHEIATGMKNGTNVNIYKYPKEIRGYVKGLVKWFKEKKPKILFTEKRVQSEKYHYTGFVDLGVEIGTDTGIIDIKTGKRIYPEVGLQLKAYSNALKEMGIKCDKTWCLRLREDGEYDFVPVNEPFNTFLNARGIYRWMKK